MPPSILQILLKQHVVKPSEVLDAVSAYVHGGCSISTATVAGLIDKARMNPEELTKLQILAEEGFQYWQDRHSDAKAEGYRGLCNSIKRRLSPLQAIPAAVIGQDAPLPATQLRA